MIGYLTVICTISSNGKIVNEALMFTNKAVKLSKGAFNNYVDKMRAGRGQEMSVFVHAQSIKTVHAGG